MLVRITNSCRMGCSHCMIDATPDGEHMSVDTFSKTLDFIKRYKLMMIMLSGGEPTDHSDFFQLAEMIKGNVILPLIISNGMFLNDIDKRNRILSLGISVQITNDARFYPKRIERFEHPLLTYETHIRMVTPLGRAKTNNIVADRASPLCFNLRSLIRSFSNFEEAVIYLRSYEKMCTPSINVDGSIVAGESSLCHRIGTVESSDAELVENILAMRCNKCGLEDNLSPLHRGAIGL